MSKKPSACVVEDNIEAPPDAMTKASIFTPEKGIVGANMKIISKDIIEFTLTNKIFFLLSI